MSQSYGRGSAAITINPQISGAKPNSLGQWISTPHGHLQPQPTLESTRGSAAGCHGRSMKNLEDHPLTLKS